MFVEQLQCIPLLGIVAGGKYQSSAGIFHSYRQFGGGCRCGTDIDNIEAHAHQSTYNNVNHHRAGDAGIMSHDYGAVGQRGGTIYKCSVCCRVFYNVYRRKCFTGTAADGAAYTGDGFYKGHNWLSMDSINICRGRLDSERRL